MKSIDFYNYYLDFYVYYLDFFALILTRRKISSIMSPQIRVQSGGFYGL